MVRKWHWTLAAFVILCIGGFLIFKPETQLEPIKTYKTVTPIPKSGSTEASGKIDHDHRHDHSHDHPRGPASHAHAVETTTNGDRYDWRDDNAFDSTLSKSDPWKQTYPVDESTDDADDTYPPRDWYKTEDPVLYIEYLQAQLIKQFGDIPEVHTFVNFEERRRFGIPIKDADEYLNFLKAQYSLWPEEITLETLKTLEKQMAQGETITFGPMEAP